MHSLPFSSLESGLGCVEMPRKIAQMHNPFIMKNSMFSSGKSKGVVADTSWSLLHGFARNVIHGQTREEVHYEIKMSLLAVNQLFLTAVGIFHVCPERKFCKQKCMPGYFRLNDNVD